MLRAITPASIHPPFARYSHGVEVPAGQRLVFCSGQLGIAPTTRPGGRRRRPSSASTPSPPSWPRPAGPRRYRADQRLCHGREHLPAYMEVRDRRFATPPPASTLMIVSGFARAEFMVEVEAVAARRTA